MIDLYIDGVAVILPTDFSTSVKRENPFITKNGEYTYDVTLSITNPVNAGLYHNINRLNTTNEIKTKRKALLVVNHHVLCNGTEVITGWTDKEVSLQIVSGNSELNYFIGSDLLISSLDMPVTSPYQDGIPDKKYVTSIYPNVDFALFPVNDRTNKILLNDWRLDSGDNLIPNSHANPFDYIPQPFLCSFIRRILQGLGYELIFNGIEETVWKDLCIVHANKTHNWNQITPGWSVKDFLEQIEILFNASFVINQFQKTAKLFLNNSYYMNTQVIHVQDVADQYEIDKEDRSNEINDVINSNISYDFPDTEYFKWRRLSKHAINKAKFETIPKGDIPLNFFNDPHNKRKDVIFKWEYDERYYIYVDHYSAGLTSAPYYRVINEFNDLVRNIDDQSKDIKISLIPAELSDKDIFSKEIEGATDLCKCPIVDSTESIATEENKTLEEIIMENESSSSDSKGKIYLAFHTGLNNSMPINDHVNSNIYPIPFTDEYIDIKPYGPVTTNNNGASLRLKTFEKTCYQNIYRIDYSQSVKITSYDKNIYDLRCIFEIRNRRYVCKEIEYPIDNTGINLPWIGTFYPIQISDTEAESRWILTDGKWRDGGVWLDNGRWLDD